MFDLPRRIAIFDTEVTTWEGTAARNWSGPNEYRELVQLGAALVDTEDFVELGTYKALAKPRRNQVLSKYFINLTHITQKEVDEHGLDFEMVLDDFYAWCEKDSLYCFDKVGLRLFDMDILIENCDLYGLEFPFELERFNNINEIFVRHGIVVQQSGRAPEAFGEEPKHRSHDALNDVRGLIRGLQLLKNKVG